MARSLRWGSELFGLLWLFRGGYHSTLMACFFINPATLFLRPSIIYNVCWGGWLKSC